MVFLTSLKGSSFTPLDVLICAGTVSTVAGLASRPDVSPSHSSQFQREPLKLSHEGGFVPRGKLGTSSMETSGRWYPKGQRSTVYEYLIEVFTVIHPSCFLSGYVNQAHDKVTSFLVPHSTLNFHEDMLFSRGVEICGLGDGKVPLD
ncbi:hypothetical protein BX600DRAFT_494422 [Xylariales sp. PMI_506]|nr:hypothetical protein BX600DRAFT_494422 [Xylariales sp. PMI_506]